MRIPSRFQSTQGKPIYFKTLQILCSALVIFCSLVILNSDPRSLSDRAEALDDQQNVAERVSEQILALGSDDWGARQAATEKLLELGPAAIEPLRALEHSSDPEIRSRVTWLLSLLAPPIYTFELLRLGGSEQVFEPLEWARSVFPVREMGEVESRRLDGLGRKLKISVEGQEPLFQIEVEISAERGSLQLNGEVPLDGITLLCREESFGVETVQGRVSVERRPAIWVGRLSRSEGAPAPFPLEDESEIWAWLQARVEDALKSEERRGAAIQVAGEWGRLDLLPTLDEVASVDRREAALARLRAGDSSVIAELETILSLHEDGTEPLEVNEQSEVAFALLKAGSDAGLDHLLTRFPEGTQWFQHRTSGALLQRLADPEFFDRNALKILATLLDPESFGGVTWSNGVNQLLLQTLQDQITPEGLAEKLKTVISEALAESTGSGASRTRLMLRVLLRTLRQEQIPAEYWLESVAALLDGTFVEEAFTLVLDRALADSISPEEFREFWFKIGNNLEGSDASRLFRSRACLVRVLEIPDLPLEDRQKLYLEQLRCFAVEGQNLRTTIDREFEQKFGKFGEKPRSHQDDEGWAKRGIAWKEHLLTLPLESFAPEPLETEESLLYTVADLRIDQISGEIEFVDCQSHRVTPGLAQVEVGPDLENRTLLIHKYPVTNRAGMYRLQGSSVLTVGRPHSRSMRRYWRNLDYLISEQRYGVKGTDRSGMIRFESLSFLEEWPTTTVPEDIEEGPEEALPKLPPSDFPVEGDSPEILWEKLCRRLAANFETATPTLRRDYFAVFSKFRIEAVRDTLIELFESQPDTQIARVLLSLGDTRGQQLLLRSVESGAPESVDILVDLLKAGEPKAIDPALDWLERSPTSKRMRGGSPYSLIQALERAFEDERLRDQFDEDRVFEVLIGALDLNNLQGVILPILRKRTGLDFGYYESFQLLDTEERTAAQQECFAQWRSWWHDRLEKRKKAGLDDANGHDRGQKVDQKQKKP